MSVPSSHRAVVMAGGKGTRLAPYTSVLPKPLIPVGGRPILETLLVSLATSGFRRVTLCVGYLAELIEAYFGRGEAYGLEIDYVHELEPSGTIGAIRALEGLDDDFLVLNGDILTDLDFAAMLASHLERGASLSIASARRHVDMAFGVMDFGPDLTLTDFREKPRIPTWVCMGVYAMSPAVLELLPATGPVGIDHLVHRSLERGWAPTVYPFEGAWFDLAGPEDCERASMFLRGEGAHLLRARSSEG